MARITGNKGEWSELYVLLYLLVTGKLYAADENIRVNRNIFSNVVKIFRNENSHEKEFHIPVDEYGNVELYIDNQLVANFSRIILSQNKNTLLAGIIGATQNRGAFSIVGADEIMNSLHCHKIKAASQDKKDILMEIHDSMQQCSQVCGFSIKSYLGELPSLLNAGKTTNFRYEVFGMTDELMTTINRMVDARGNAAVHQRMQTIVDVGCNVVFDSVISSIFGRNVALIDTNLGSLLAEMLKANYFDGCITCRDAIDRVWGNNVLGYPDKDFYEYKFKRFLEAVALGMKPATVWSGQEDANAGYIIVRDDGEVLAYYLYDRNTFCKYLLENTKFEHGSTSRHDFAKIYKLDGHYYLNLNLQIRFVQ